MTDPRNIAHDKKVRQEKKHHGEDIAQGTNQAPQPGKKPHTEVPPTDHPADPDPDADSENGKKPGEDA